MRPPFNPGFFSRLAVVQLFFVPIGIGFTRPHSCIWSPIWYVRHTSRQTAWIKQQHRGTYSFFRSLVCLRIKSDHREPFSYRTDPFRFSPCINASMLMGFKLDVTLVMVTTGAARSNITWFQKPFSMEACVPLSFDEMGSFEDECGDGGWKLGVWEKPCRFRQQFCFPSLRRSWLPSSCSCFQKEWKKNPFVRAKVCCPLGALEKFCAACIIKEERKDGVIWLLQKKNIKKKNKMRKRRPLTVPCATCTCSIKTKYVVLTTGKKWSHCQLANCGSW